MLQRLLPANCLCSASTSAAPSIAPLFERWVALSGGHAAAALDAQAASTSSAPATQALQLRFLHASASRSRFYKSVEVKEGDQGYTILLGRHVVKTPAKRELLLPTYPLAMAIAAEWAWQVRR